MADHSTNEFRSGLKVLLDGEPHTIIESEFVKPGKGQAFTRARFRNLVTGRVIERTMKSGESLPGADVVELELQYLYNDGESWHFMDPRGYEQHAVPAAAVGDAGRWLKGQELCQATLYNGRPLSIAAPNFADLEVTETEPGVRGDTAAGATKNATLETGAVIKVPLFVEQGETIRVDTRTGAYVNRVKAG